MERAIILSPSLVNSPVAPKLVGNAAVYLGDDFCIHKQPSFRDVEAVTRMTGRMPVLLGTVLTEPALRGWTALLAKCAKKAPGAEIVVNDIGLLHFINANYRGVFRLALGRLMTYFFDPRNSRVLGSGAGCGPAGKKLKLWENRLNDTPSAYLSRFIERHGVERVETDSERVFNKYAEHTDIKISFHYPIRLMAMTRFCPFKGGFADKCSAPCGLRMLRLKTPHMDHPLFAKGNAYFVRNRLIRHPRLDRAVRTPFVRSPGFPTHVNEGSIRG